MVQIKYVGTGLYSQGTYFKPDVNNGLYDLDNKMASYLVKTFPKDFILIEKKADKPVQTKRVKRVKQSPNKVD